MPKLLCPCGFIHDLSPIPDEGWRTIRDQDYEHVIEDEIHLAKISDAEIEKEQYGTLIWNINSATGLLYLCPQCGRIMWRRENSDKFTVYIPDMSEDKKP